MKHSRRLEIALEWALLGLIILTVMGFGALRMHQLALNTFLIASFAIIAALMFVYRLVYRRFFLKEEAADDAKPE